MDEGFEIVNIFKETDDKEKDECSSQTWGNKKNHP